MPEDNALVALERAVQRTARWVSVLLVAFVVLVAGGAAYACWQASDLLAPTNLVGRAKQQLREDYPEIRKEIQRKVAEAAPALARRASRRVLAELPDLRARLKPYLEQQIDAGLKQGEILSEKALRRFLQEHHQMIEEWLDRIRRAPEEAPKFAAKLEKEVDQRLGSDLLRDAHTGLELLRQWNAKLAKLGQERDLTPAEQAELRIVRLLRALQVRAIGS
jgi:hypothetical protein